ncbi:MAG: hypothetical protein NZ602_16845 [Thermoguttaceae bacterium]|nr:hypothetical protein [Thermoguttaceae bacterium]MDW8038250.1 hypothetical protein [Thermoguttaceae bacterium]
MGQAGKAQELFQRLLDEFPSEHWHEAIPELAEGDPQLEAELRALVAAYESAQKHGF